MATNSGPHPFSLIRAASITPAALQSLRSQGSQDLAEFVWPEEERPTIPHNDYRRDRELPVIDLAGLQDGSAETKLRLGKRVAAACSVWGFFQLVNHGVPVAELDEVQSQTRRFFELPMEQKQCATNLETANANSNVFGYGINTSGYKYAGRPWIERFQCSWSPKANIREQAQRLLDGPPCEEFQKSVESFCASAEQLAHLTLELCALGLGLPGDTFTQHLHPSHSIARLNYYPACPTPDLTLGLGAHTDPYTLTMLHQCQVGGLQVCKDGKWITVRPRRGAYVVNVGDNLQAWTNGRFKSVEHRAVLNDKVPRLSLAFFYAPSLDTLISAPDALVQADRRRRYKNFTWGEYLDYLKQQNYEKGKNEQWVDRFAL
jgi:gibberellin 20-oxidase